MGDPELKNWVADNLYALVGFAESAVVSYVISNGRKATKAADLAKSLVGAGLPAGSETERFAAELMGRIPRAGTAVSAYKQQERAALAVTVQNRKYAMLELSDDDEQPASPPAAPTTSALPAGRKKHTRRREAPAEDAGEQDAPIALGKRRQRAWEENSDDEEAAEEARKQVQREQDQQEKEEFEARLRARDEEKTRKLMEARLSKEEMKDLARRKYETEEEKEELVPQLREVSRQEYLKKREEQQVAALEDGLRDEELLFAGVQLTSKEAAELAYKREVLRLAKERLADLAEVTANDGYHMPDAYDGDRPQQSKRYELLTQRYRPDDEEAEESTPWAEQQTWEALQIANASMKTGAKAGRKGGRQYDLVFEDQIDFVTNEVLAGVEVEELEDPAQAELKAREAAKQSAFEKLQSDRRSLPMFPYREALLDAIAKHNVLIIVGETGSGKTTQIPQYLHEAGYSKSGRIGCTQPRRVAAMSVAARVAEEVGCKLGAEVGYSIRFEDCTSDRTVVKYMTDGMLLREFLGEPDLATYSVMMVDEAHERTLHTDVLFGLVKDIARARDDIKLLISSATLDAEKFSEYFDGAPVFRIPGRRYPVDIMYTKAPESDYLNAAVVTTIQVHATQPPGDVLIFLTGQEEIEAAEELLKQRMKGQGAKLGEMIIAPIYANLPSDLQAKIFEPTPPGARKVVLATNIAETSLTIDGIRYVIDPGFCKQNSYNPRSGMFSLQVTPVSKASAMQRTGRAGRTAPGKCFRLYTAWAFQHELEDNTVPEIQRTNLGNVVLMLKSLGINDLMGFDFMDPPPPETLLRALEQLYALGALNDRGELTKLGRRMAEFPTDPMLAKMIIAAEGFHCTEEVATICAMLGIGNAVFYRPKDKAVHADNAHKNFHRGNVGDHIALLNVYNNWAESNFSSQFCYENFVQVRSMKRARDVRDQLVGLMERVELEMESSAEDHDAIKKAITSGFFYNAAQLQKNGNYRTVKNPQTVHMHPSSGLAEALPRWIVFNELVLTSKEYVRTVSEIKPEWLAELAPHFYSKKDLQSAMTTKMPKVVGRAAIDAQ